MLEFDVMDSFKSDGVFFMKPKYFQKCVLTVSRKYICLKKGAVYLKVIEYADFEYDVTI